MADKPLIKFEDFKKLDIKTAKVLKVEPHPNADKLYLVTITAGGPEKTIVAGIRPYYKPEELIGRSIVIVDNLEPIEIRGVVSAGMLLAAKDGASLTVIIPEREIGTGSIVS